MENIKKTFKEIRLKVKEIINRPPTKEQIEDLKNTFIEIELNEKPQKATP